MYLKTTYETGLLRYEYYHEHASKKSSAVTLSLEIFKSLAQNRSDPYLDRRTGSKFLFLAEVHRRVIWAQSTL